MKFVLFPEESRPYCLLLVGGTGDTAERFLPLVEKLNTLLPNHSICALTLTDAPIADLLNEQADELADIFQKLLQQYPDTVFDIFCTSMGSYATIKLITDKRYTAKFRKILLFDPADYYLDLPIKSPEDEITWSGYQEYKPTGSVISDELNKLTSGMKIDVIHLTLRNHGPDGYKEQKETDRGVHHPQGYPRLNTQMVKSFYTKIPVANRGFYREIEDIPHGFFRDGDIPANISKIAAVISETMRISN